MASIIALVEYYLIVKTNGNKLAPDKSDYFDGDQYIINLNRAVKFWL